MNTKEYTYDIGKYTIGVDKNGEDEIGITIIKIENGEIYFLGNCYGENARCLDLLIKENQELKKQYENAVADYETTMAEKSELKKQLENANEKIILLQASEPMINYNKSIENAQQKEFIKYLKDMLDDKNDMFSVVRVIDVLQKYKEIIGENYV